MDEICRSNIIQRDNVKFAKKLNKQLVPLAKEKNKTVCFIFVISSFVKFLSRRLVSLGTFCNIKGYWGYWAVRL